MAAGRPAWRAVTTRLQRLLSSAEAELRDAPHLQQRFILPQASRTAMQALATASTIAIATDCMPMHSRALPSWMWPWMDVLVGMQGGVPMLATGVVFERATACGIVRRDCNGFCMHAICMP